MAATARRQRFNLPHFRLFRKRAIERHIPGSNAASHILASVLRKVDRHSSTIKIVEDPLHNSPIYQEIDPRKLVDAGVGSDAVYSNTYPVPSLLQDTFTSTGALKSSWIFAFPQPFSNG